MERNSIGFVKYFSVDKISIEKSEKTFFSRKLSLSVIFAQVFQHGNKFKFSFLKAHPEYPNV